MAKHRTEQVYDDEMAPLVTKLIEIAEREGMPLFVTAGMVNEDGGAMACTTAIPDETGLLPGIGNRIGLCTEIVRGHVGFDTAAGMVITRHHTPQEQD